MKRMLKTNFQTEIRNMFCEYNEYNEYNTSGKPNYLNTMGIKSLHFTEIEIILRNEKILKLFYKCQL